MERTELKAILEALLFAADSPLPLELLAETTDREPAELGEALSELKAEYSAQGRGVSLEEMAGGWLFVSREQFAPYVAKMLRGKKKMRLSRAALEALAIIAYKQPVTRVEVEAIRGVDSGGVLHTLLERDLVTIRGRSKVVGRPLLYGTTGEFLSYFGLRDLAELPRVEELKALVGEREPENPEAVLDLPPVPGGGGHAEIASENADEDEDDDFDDGIDAAPEKVYAGSPGEPDRDAERPGEDEGLDDGIGDAL